MHRIPLVLTATMLLVPGLSGCKGDDPAPDCYIRDAAGECFVPDPDSGGGPLNLGCGEFPVAAVDATFIHDLIISGGSGDYQLSVTGLPAGLSVSTTGQISGRPEEAGDFQVSVTLNDVVTGESASEDCELLTVEDALAFDPLTAPKGCIEVSAAGVDIRDSLEGGTGAAITCSIPAGSDPNGTCPNGNGNGVTPAGIEWSDDTCTASGSVTETAVGTWVWIAKVEQSGAEVFVPLCASRELEAGAPHDLDVLLDGGNDYLQPAMYSYASGEAVEFGPDDGGPVFEVFGSDCSGGQCNGYGFSYVVTCSPFCGANESLPNGGTCAQTFATDPSDVIDNGSGIEGFFHNLFATTEVPLSEWANESVPARNWNKRPWVASFDFGYCTGANETACTENGTLIDVQTELHYAVVGWPE